MSSPTQSSLSWFRRHRLAVFGWGGIALLLLLLFAFGQLQRHLTQRKIDAKFAAIRAQGLPVTLAELNNFYTLVPAVENGALTLIQHRNHYVEWDHNAPWIGALSSNNVLVVTNPITPAARAALHSIILSNQTALRFIYDSTTNKYWRYPIDLNQGSAAPLSHLVEIKSAVMLLGLESLHHLAEDRHQQALKSVETSLLLADTLAQEPLLISLLVRRACLAIAINQAERLLQRDEFAALDLSRLQQALAASEKKSDIFCVLHGERAFITGSWNDPVSKHLGNSWFSPETPFDHLPAPVQRGGWAIYEEGGHKEADLLNFLALFEELTAAAKLNPLAALEQGRLLEDRLSSTSKPSMDMIMTTYVSGHLVKSIKLIAEVVARLRVAQTAIAIERFRMENQRLPQSLGELIPQYLKSAPLDPYTEAPLLYRITKNGFRVYSAGENGADDGGLSRAEANSVQKQSDDIPFTVERLKTP